MLIFTQHWLTNNTSRTLYKTDIKKPLYPSPHFVIPPLKMMYMGNIRSSRSSWKPTIDANITRYNNFVKGSVSQGNRHQRNKLIYNSFSYKMTVNVDMFSSLVKYRIRSGWDMVQSYNYLIQFFKQLNVPSRWKFISL